MKVRESTLKKAAWLERHGKWYYVFKGVFLAGMLLTIVNWGIVCGLALLQH